MFFVILGFSRNFTDTRYEYYFMREALLFMYAANEASDLESSRDKMRAVQAILRDHPVERGPMQTVI